MIIIGGSSSHDLASRVARDLDVNDGKLEIRRFPDGEKYLRVLEDVKNQDLVVIQSVHHTPDELFFEYLLLVDTLKDLGARRVISFFPYFAYARQDERFKSGEAISFKTVSKLTESVGTDEVYTIDMHGHRVIKLSEVFKIPAHNLSAVPLLAEYAKKTWAMQKPLVIGPDAEAEQWARVAAEKLGTDYDIFEKKRLGDRRVEVQPRKANAKDRDILIIDDIISTGGTIVEALKVLFGQGARTVNVACTHPILAGDALAKIRGAGAKNIVGTDTVPSPISHVSVAPLIAEQLKKAGLSPAS